MKHSPKMALAMVRDYPRFYLPLAWVGTGSMSSWKSAQNSVSRKHTSWEQLMGAGTVLHPAWLKHHLQDIVPYPKKTCLASH